MNKKKKFGVFCLILGAVLIAAAVTLLIHNESEDSSAGEASAEVLAEMKAELPDETDMTQNIYSAFDGTDSGEMNTIEIDGYLYIGYISLPTLGLELPVMEQCDYSRLTIAPCRYYGSYKTDDLVIAGHSYKRHFRYIRNMSPGDPVIFTDADGVVRSYTVAETEMVDPDDVDHMTDSEYPLTLFTCTYTGAQRATVRCVYS